MKVQSSENKLVITEEFIFDQNKLPSDPNNHFKLCGSSQWAVVATIFNASIEIVLCIRLELVL